MKEQKNSRTLQKFFIQFQNSQHGKDFKVLYLLEESDENLESQSKKWSQPSSASIFRNIEQ